MLTLSEVTVAVKLTQYMRGIKETINTAVRELLVMIYNEIGHCIKMIQMLVF